jgi:hypothetical protein
MGGHSRTVEVWGQPQAKTGDPIWKVTKAKKGQGSRDRVPAYQAETLNSNPDTVYHNQPVINYTWYFNWEKTKVIQINGEIYHVHGLESWLLLRFWTGLRRWVLGRHLIWPTHQPLSWTSAIFGGFISFWSLLAICTQNDVCIEIWVGGSRGNNRNKGSYFLLSLISIFNI